MADRHEITKDELSILQPVGPGNCYSSATHQQRNMQAIAGSGTFKQSPAAENASDHWQQKCKRSQSA